MISNPEIRVPLAVVITALIIVALVLWSMVFLLRKKAQTTCRTKEPDWSVPAIDAYASGQSFFHRWDPRLKIATLFLFCFCIAALTSLFVCGISLGISIFALLACRIPLRRALRRLGAMAGFLAMFVLFLPFTSPLREGELLIFFPYLESWPYHFAGFLLALSIVTKACAIAIIMEPLFGTAPLPVTLQAMTKLGIPQSITQMMLLCHRYIFVFLGESKRMYKGMQVRGFSPRTNIATMQAMGNFFGMLFIRSFDRTQRVHEAMLSRGYSGVFPTYTVFRSARKDWLKSLCFLIIGIILLFLDRYYG